MSPEDMDHSAGGYTFGSIVSWIGTVICGIGFAEAPDHLGWFIGALGLLVLTIVFNRPNIAEVHMSGINVGIPPRCPICLVSSGSTHPSNCPNYGQRGPSYSHAGPPPLTLCNKDGSDVLLFEGSRLEWDVLAGIGIPGAGTCAGIGKSFPVAGVVDVPPICIQIDPNEKLRTLAAKVRSESFLSTGLPRGLPPGLDGEGGFLIMAGDDIWRGVQQGTVRVLDERRAPETYRPAMAQWLADQKRIADMAYPFRGPVQ